MVPVLPAFGFPRNFTDDEEHEEDEGANTEGDAKPAICSSVKPNSVPMLSTLFRPSRFAAIRMRRALSLMKTGSILLVVGAGVVLEGGDGRDQTKKASRSSNRGR